MKLNYLFATLIAVQLSGCLVTLDDAPVADRNGKLPNCIGSDTSRWNNCFGTYTWPSGEKYVGEWKKGYRNGQGNTTWSNGEKYVGEFRDNKITGQGIYTYADGSPPQEGIWENYSFVRAQRIPDHIAGRTTSTPPTTVALAASYPAQSNLPACRGSDESQWTNCFGTHPFRNGASYVGGFKEGKYHGQGTISYGDGSIYVGELMEGRYHGQGTITYRDGSSYVGNFSEGSYHGVGTRTANLGPIYVGEFREGQFHGQGTITYRDGSNYVGEFTNGYYDGQGAYTKVGRPPQEGIWKNGVFVRAKRIPDHIAGRTPSTPPTVAIAPRQAEASRSTLNLTASASSPDSNGVVTLAITTNSDTASLRVNGDEVGGRADGRYSVQRFAQIGDNNFEVIATDRFGNTRRQTISVSRQAADNTVRFASLNPIAVRARPANNAVAIIIGIQDYRRVSKAEFANNDARVFYDYAVRGLGVRPENIKLLVDQEADQVEVLSAFKNWLPLKTRKGQTDVYVFYSGHGLPSDDGSNLYMLPHGVDRQFLNETAIKQSVLIAALQAASPRSVTMFMDACYSGQSRTGETLLASARPIAIQSKASSFPANFNVISASAPDQLASSSPDLKHGMFSYFLMKGMEGEADENKDGNITMAEMQSYLKEYVGKKAMSLNRTQVPQLTGDQSRVLVSR